MIVRGWAVIDGGKINVCTVSDTRRAAIVNWLIVQKCVMVLASTTDEEIERLWWENRGTTAEVSVVVIDREH